MSNNRINVKSTVVGVGVFLGGTLINPSIDYYTNMNYKSHDKTCRYSDFNKVEPTSDISGRFSEITPISKITNDEDIQVVSSFIESILCNSKPMDSELAELIDDNFWNLV